MDWFAFTEYVNTQVEALRWYVIGLFNFLYAQFLSLYSGVVSLSSWIQGVVSTIGKILRRAANALRNFSITRLWQELIAWYKRFHRWIEWYRKNVLGPLNAYYRNLLHLYDQFFRPIINAIDQLRRLNQILALFNHKLAAKIDSALFSLESRIMAPLLAALRRVNTLASIQSAFLTRLGLFDRSTLLVSLKRDWKLVWTVLLNGARLPKPGDLPGPAPGIHQVSTDFKEFTAAATGPFATQNDELKRFWDDTLAQLA